MLNGTEPRATIWRATAIEQKCCSEVAILSFYSAQRRVLKGHLDRWNRGLKKPGLQTVDSFQGSECSVVCLSVVRSSAQHGFLNDFQRMNV